MMWVVPMPGWARKARPPAPWMRVDGAFAGEADFRDVGAFADSDIAVECVLHGLDVTGGVEFAGDVHAADGGAGPGVGGYGVQGDRDAESVQPSDDFDGAFVAAIAEARECGVELSVVEPDAEAEDVDFVFAVRRADFGSAEKFESCRACGGFAFF